MGEIQGENATGKRPKGQRDKSNEKRSIRKFTSDNSESKIPKRELQRNFTWDQSRGKFQRQILLTILKENVQWEDFNGRLPIG